MKSKIFSSDYVKVTSKGQAWIPAFLALGFLMAFPVAELLIFGNWSGAEYTAEKIEFLYENLWRDGFLATGFIIICAAALLNGANSFWYLYSSRKVDFYHCLPMKKTQMFWHRTYVGILNYLIPYVVMEFLAICIGAMRGHFSLKLMGMAVEMLVLHFILYLLVYFSVVLAICLTGNILMGVLALLTFFLYGPVLGSMISYYREVFFSTSYSTNKNWGLVKVLKEYLSPVFLGRTLLEKYAGEEYFGTLGLVIAVTAVAGVFAFTAYVKRPAEATCKPVIYDWVGVLVRYLIVIPGGLGFGIIFCMLPGKQGWRVWWIFGMVLGTVLIHGFIEVLYQLDFRKFFSKKLQLLLAGALVAVCAVCYHQDLFKFDVYVPEKEDIRTVCLNFYGMGNINHAESIEKTEDGTYLTSIGWDDEKRALNQGNGIGEETYRALENIIQQQKQRGTSRYRQEEYEYEENLYYLPVKYSLTSGREIYREYKVSGEEIYELMYALYTEGTLKEKQNSYLQIDSKYLDSVSMNACNGQRYSLFQDDMNKNIELLEALRLDLQEASAEELLGIPCAELEFSYMVPEEQQALRGILENQFLNYWYSEALVYPSFERTVAILEETGYPMTMEEIDLKSVEVTYYCNDENGKSAADTISYKSEEELAAFKEALVPVNLAGSWMEMESSIDVIYEIEDGWNKTYAYLLKDKVPGFVAKTREEFMAGKALSEN